MYACRHHGRRLSEGHGIIARAFAQELAP